MTWFACRVGCRISKYETEICFLFCLFFYLLPKCNAKTVLNQFLCVLAGGKQNIAFKLHRATVHLEDMFLNLDVGLRCHVYRNLLFPKNHWAFKWRGVRTCMAGVGPQNSNSSGVKILRVG